MPLEPVYDNPDGSLMVPKFNYREKRADWQAAIDAKQPRQHWGAPTGATTLLEFQRMEEERKAAAAAEAAAKKKKQQQQKQAGGGDGEAAAEAAGV